MKEWLHFYKLLNCTYYPRSSTFTLTSAVVLSFPANAHTTVLVIGNEFPELRTQRPYRMTCFTQLKFVKLGGPRQSHMALKVEPSYKSSSFRCICSSQPLKMELTEGSETSANYNLTPGKYPKGQIHYSKHGESLKSRIVHSDLE
jgi:hypothetical protein